MNKYIGVKLVEAEPMNLGDYNTYRGWQIPKDENPARDGFLVKYEDGYESWSPATIFEKAYRRIDAMTFGLAIEALKIEKKVCRKGWNGKGMFLVLVKPGRDFVFNDSFGMFANEVQLSEYVAMKTSDNNFIPWLASQSDILAEDWMVVE